jgi:hypothetical protein
MSGSRRICPDDSHVGGPGDPDGVDEQVDAPPTHVGRDDHAVARIRRQLRRLSARRRARVQYAISGPGAGKDADEL